ncbi:DUF1854 domain-containing protein [Herbaspirillum sp. RTI4]|uniref:cyanophycin metabolism-associated DUF1854 family protein n=1 Tax=Herbaspirillum sp. RTI4 TaxID=3048640 RepID=UPI002AB51D08|nr:DUF1854 domain-containing protein [Herbaspirillum sp. RTI4]MDY7578686.1 DUF1854 domain-containing protein [Herbaspirillum sp. RTI4]MEA9980616.1 DUF1854 domain-containing protein [Herbaspirillum sp. RTI4]
MNEPDFTLSRNSAGKLVFVGADGVLTEGVVPVRAFPIAAPDEGLALVNADGMELAWVEQLADLPPAMLALVEEELARREFMPQISRICSVSTYATPSVWAVQTDRGDTSFILRGEEDIRRLPDAALLISDSHGIQFLIRNMEALDQNSRKILDRFL